MEVGYRKVLMAVEKKKVEHSRDGYAPLCLILSECFSLHLHLYHTTVGIEGDVSVFVSIFLLDAVEDAEHVSTVSEMVVVPYKC